MSRRFVNQIVSCRLIKLVWFVYDKRAREILAKEKRIDAAQIAGE